MERNKIIGIIWGILIIAGLALTIYVFWPLFLILALIIGYKIFQYRQALKHVEKGQSEEVRTSTSYQDDLFHQEINNLRRNEDTEVIDVEFTRKEEEPQAEGRQDI